MEASPGDEETWVHPRPLLATSDVHRHFVKLRTARDILRFANRYGLLHPQVQLIAKPIQDQPPSAWDVHPRAIEPVFHWTEAIAWMDVLVKLWDFVKSQNEEELRRYVWWNRSPRTVSIKLFYAERNNKRRLFPMDQTGRPRYGNRDANAVHLGLQDVYVELARQGEPNSETVLAHWQDGEVIGPTYYYICSEVNRHLRERVHPAVLLDNDGQGQFYFQPDSLLAALYTLFAVELSGQDRPRVLCARQGCGDYFTVEHKAMRYCSERCRQLAYYYRKTRTAARAHRQPD